jgi:hypothetical protein
MTAEVDRLAEARRPETAWKKWGPYLSERQWGTVREDCSSDGTAWDSFPHDHARSRAYRWGEDGLGGICDDQQLLCFAVALWNGHDPIIKERLFGLTNGQGNHGEDVKEYYFYLDSTPTHSYMKYLYKYPQAAYPYEDIVATNGRRGLQDFEYELLDTGVFDDDRYFDVFVEYAKSGPEDICVKISIHNRGAERARLDVLPTLWFRNTWSWTEGSARPSLRKVDADAQAVVCARYTDDTAGGLPDDYFLYCDKDASLLFTENETNNQRLWGTPNPSRYVKDGINDCVVDGAEDAVNPDGVGTKVAARYQVDVEPGSPAVIYVRLTRTPPAELREPFRDVEAIFRERQAEADQFYADLTPPSLKDDADRASVLRQALGGLLWSKQFFNYDLSEWLRLHGAHPLVPGSHPYRNREWVHMVNRDIISMPDTWEYPWYAAWDLAFHTVPMSIVDPDFANQQIELMLSESYLHPSGQIPAYEWAFGDVNPPVHAWAAMFRHRHARLTGGKPDLNLLESLFHKLVLNFTWWVNRKDRSGNNVFEGGFLGLDNIGVFDRSAPLPTGGYLEQADGTAWMAFFCESMMAMAIELTSINPIYQSWVRKFADHLAWIGGAINRSGDQGMWDEEDGFYYDVLQLPDGTARRLKVRSLVGLLPLCATSVIEPWQRERVPTLAAAYEAQVQRMPELANSLHPLGPAHFGVGNRTLLALVTPERLRRILTRMLDEEEFLGPNGIRSLSKYHERNPYVLRMGDQEYRVGYLPAESDSGMFGSNSNWRGPVWFPTNVILIRALLELYRYYGDNFKIECPTGSGREMNLYEVAREISERLIRIFLRDEQGRRPVYGGTEKFQNDPHWRDYVLFHEYFHGDNGAGLGASHQTGWTALVATLIRTFGFVGPEDLLAERQPPPASEAEDATATRRPWEGIKAGVRAGLAGR